MIFPSVIHTVSSLIAHFLVDIFKGVNLNLNLMGAYRNVLS